MSDIEKFRQAMVPQWAGLREGLPQGSFRGLVSAFVPPGTPRSAILEFVITVDDHDMPTREFAGYLALVDRLYGRLSPGGLRSYAHRDRGRLNIAECRKSELEIIL